MKTILLFFMTVFCFNYASTQTVTVMNASHSYDIIDLRFSLYGLYGDIMPEYKLKLNLPIPSRAGLKVHSLEKGYYYILYTMSNNRSYEVRNFKLTKDVVIWLGKNVESSDYWK